LSDDSIIIVNVYRHPNQHIPFNVYNQLFSTLLEKYRNLVIVGDFNAHHTWWRCHHEDSYGKILSRVIDAHKLIILNDRLSPTLFHPTVQHSIIDLVLTSENIATRCNSVVGLDTLGVITFPFLLQL